MKVAFVRDLDLMAEHWILQIETLKNAIYANGDCLSTQKFSQSCKVISSNAFLPYQGGYRVCGNLGRFHYVVTCDDQAHIPQVPSTEIGLRTDTSKPF